MLVIVVLFSFLFSAIELKEFFKLPQLLSHFHEHKASNNKLSLVDFLWMHYSSPSDKDGDQDQDAKLPFKQHDHFFFSDISFSLNKTYSFIFNLPEQVAPELRIERDFHIPSGISNNIWQPPKFS